MSNGKITRDIGILNFWHIWDTLPPPNSNLILVSKSFCFFLVAAAINSDFTVFTVYIVALLDIHLRKDQARAIPTFFIAM